MYKRQEIRFGDGFIKRFFTNGDIIDTCRIAIEGAIAHGCIAFSGRITSQGFVTMSGIIATGGVK